MPTAKEIQIQAIDKIAENHVGTESLFRLGLQNIEALVETHMKNDGTHPAMGPARHLLNRITENGQYMIVLVFSQDHSKVTALPMPEIFKNKERVQLAAASFPTKNIINELMTSIEALLSETPRTREGNALAHTVVIQQNLGEFRNNKQLSIGVWDTWKATRYRFSNEYDSWIRDVQRELNTTPSPSK